MPVAAARRTGTSSRSRCMHQHKRLLAHECGDCSRPNRSPIGASLTICHLVACSCWPHDRSIRVSIQLLPDNRACSQQATPSRHCLSMDFHDIPLASDVHAASLHFAAGVKRTLGTRWSISAKPIAA
ncbi:hypothetical protein HDV57DRAFT_157472 [Trichoderma longibrachiatum]|uniref:Uncharacterized protein n=1 Tax=Trichoderma longibrachiatum ATCC 18648 TaxID=983965 RepID=A0A2T4CBC4_TRILO|nr:hypothetical protein M440DRAFT_1203203 [Trichoderma longibrachiatum ATCC 18648]